MRRTVSFVALAMLIIGISAAAMPPTPTKSIKGAGGSTKQEVSTGFLQYKDYALFVPHKYKGDKETKSYPLILFLHGEGQTKKPHGPPEDVPGLGPHIRDHEKIFPFFVIFPRGAHDGQWFKDDKPLDAARALEILQAVQKEFQCIDTKKLYLTGVGSGGRATWEIAAEHPELWAAIAPLSGSPPGAAAPSNLKPGSKESIAAAETFAKYVAPKIKDIPVWCFHEKSDGVSGAEWTEKIALELKAKSLPPGESPPTKSGHSFFTLFDDCGPSLAATAHEQCSKNAYSDPKANSKSDERDSLYEWLLKHHRK
jgi:dienelactone hydrolase